MKYNVLTSIWWTPSTGNLIGAVVIRTTEDKLKAYIGNGMGWDQSVDEQVIAGNGATLIPPIAHAMFPNYKIEDFAE